MKKRLLSVFLCLCMVFGLVPATVWAETTTGHTHYLCGGSTCNGSGHENETYKTTFEKEIKQEGNTLKIGDKSWAPTKGSNDTFYILPTGTYYLGSDISPEYTIKIENNVTLCLNGHKITAADGMDAIYMTGGSFTLTDCKGVGHDHPCKQQDRQRRVCEFRHLQYVRRQHHRQSCHRRWRRRV